MITKIVLLIMFLILIFAEHKSQTLQAGFRYEPAYVFIEENNRSVNGIAAISMYFTGLYHPTDWLTLEIRPGYFVADQDYGGFEIGGYARVKLLPTNFFVIAGINNHHNTWDSAHNGGGAYKKDMLFYVLGIGFQKGSKLSLDVSYHFSSDKSFGYSRVTDWLTYSYFVDKKLNGMIKLGLSITSDIY
jgi:hypothetical protein